ncbi:DNA-formamidopyrimidine glycosylase [Heliorestis acidaminivorans]|uniref:Formamidopyrimidine-DNA glycosylase n=1 Tax=Heliorestis acidaminivorans TaxID=553427 RepID=A0A6I0F0L3_9FIRM|nr:DNA-formamidopyrimidine glycosylase [Heliorestis acidaminivorans]KAB2951855.1 DNA-formamidopyrimidine glycosylase [Heliorestis acidaminivorans]
MPELPEVETVRRSLEPKIVGRTIKGLTINLPRIVNSPPGHDFAETLIGKSFEKLERRGKYLLCYLSEDYCLVVHLRMTGRLIHCSPEEPIVRHSHVLIELDDGQQLRYIDVRQFGTLTLRKTEELDKLSGLKDLGPEPLGEDFTLAEFQKAIASKKRNIKALLLDQRFIAGLGNIYVDEALARAALHPDRLASDLASEEVDSLYQSIRQVLEEGISARGTSFRDYVDGEGNKGDFQNRLWVYGRAGQPCPRCKEPIQREKKAGRGTHFCPCCQR